MTTYPDDRARTGDSDVTTRSEPLAEDGQPIFPPVGDTDPGIARQADAEAGVLDDRDDREIDLRDADVRTEGHDTQGRYAGSEDADLAPPILPDGRTPDATPGATRLDPDDAPATAYAAEPIQSEPIQSEPIPAVAGPADPVPADATGVEPVTAETAAVPASGAAHRADDDEQAWLELQGTFVDDPAEAVRRAGERVEGELASFRQRLDSADTEALRTAFRQFRDLSAILR